MKLKLVVASMSVLGLVSCPVFAAHQSKHKHHQKMMKHQQVAASHDYKDYKDMGPAPEVCMISASSMTMNEMSQNMGRSMPNPCNPGWFNRIQFSGGVNIDLGKWGNRNANYMGENYQRFSLNDVYLNMAAVINDWTKAFASISYGTPTINDPSMGTMPVAEYSSAYTNNLTSGSTATMQIEQAYATFGNFDMTPFFLQIGKQFQDYSRYEIHPITRSLTQVVSETLATSAELGFIANGFNGTLYAFDDPIAKVGQTNNPTNYGVALGYNQPSDQLGWDIGGAYMYNMIGVNDVAFAVNQFNTKMGAGSGYNSRVGATAWYADVNSGPFTLGGRYTTALERFNMADLPKNGTATSTTGAKPWAAGVQAGYGFDAWGKNQNLYVGYQASREAAGLLLPEARWILGYGIDLFGKNTSVGAEWDRDIAYDRNDGGIGDNTNLVSLRFAVKFA